MELAILSLCSESHAPTGRTGTPDTAQSGHTFTSSKRSFPGSLQTDTLNTPKVLFRKKIGSSRPKQITVHSTCCFLSRFLSQQAQGSGSQPVPRAGGGGALRIAAVTRSAAHTAGRERAACQGSSAPSKQADQHRQGEGSLCSTPQHAVVFLLNE